jgi:hypothetical protein
LSFASGGARGVGHLEGELGGALLADGEPGQVHRDGGGRRAGAVDALALLAAVIEVAQVARGLELVALGWVMGDHQLDVEGLPQLDGGRVGAHLELQRRGNGPRIGIRRREGRQCEQAGTEGDGAQHGSGCFPHKPR